MWPSMVIAQFMEPQNDLLVAQIGNRHSGPRPPACRQHAASMPRRAPGIPRHCTGMPRHCAGMPRHCAGMPRHCAGMPRHCAGMPRHCAGMPRHCAGTPRHCAGMPSAWRVDHGAPRDADLNHEPILDTRICSRPYAKFWRNATQITNAATVHARAVLDGDRARPGAARSRGPAPGGAGGLRPSKCQFSAAFPPPGASFSAPFPPWVDRVSQHLSPLRG